jgi:hypothetical protein
MIGILSARAMSDRALQLISNLLKNPDGCVTESNSLVGMADCIVYDADMS